MEGRGLTEEDWAIDDLNSSATSGARQDSCPMPAPGASIPSPTTSPTPPITAVSTTTLDPKQRKAKERQLNKLEEKLEKRFAQVDKLQGEMEKEAEKHNFDKVADLQAKLEALEKEMEGIMDEIEAAQAEIID